LACVQHCTPPEKQGACHLTRFCSGESKVIGEFIEKIIGKSSDPATTLAAEAAQRQADTGMTISGTVAEKSAQMLRQDSQEMNYL